MRVRSVSIGRVWVCILSSHESDECGYGKGGMIGGDVYATLMQSDDYRLTSQLL